MLKRFYSNLGIDLMPTEKTQSISIENEELISESKKHNIVGEYEVINGSIYSIFTYNKSNYLFLKDQSLLIDESINIKYQVNYNYDELSYFEIFKNDVLLIREEYKNEREPLIDPFGYEPDWEHINFSYHLYSYVKRVKDNPAINLFPKNNESKLIKCIEGDNLLDYYFYIHKFNNKDIVIRVIAGKSVYDNISSLESFENGDWKKQTPVIKSFMNHYATGWIHEKDKINPKIVEEIVVLCTPYKVIKARDYAVKKHNSQRYGSYPYEVHLTNVVSILLHFGAQLQKNTDLFSAAWLHDVIEDTDADKAWITSNCGEDVREIVELVSNIKNPSKTKLENKEITFENIATNQNAIIVKLADRIANVEFSLLHGNIEMIKKYKDEQSLIRDLISHKIETTIGKRLFLHLEEIINSNDSE